MSIKRVQQIVNLCISAIALQCAGQLTLNPLFTDHMVLQRNRAVPVYGTAAPGAEVTVEFAGQTKTATTDFSNHWKIILDPMPASSKPRVLQVSSFEFQVSFSDVLVGDIWLCGGQSNMAREMDMFPALQDDIAAMENSQVRLFKVKREGVGSETPSEDVVVDPMFENSWQLMTPEYARAFSATAAFFGSELQPLINVPVGLIYANRGGTQVNMWLPMDVMKKKPKLYERWLSDANPWWTEKKGNRGLIRAPSRLYNGTIHPLIPFAIRGVVWYQGESDRRDVDVYAEMFADLIRSWRKAWNTNFPFLFVQLPGYNGSAVSWDERGEVLAFLREAQASALALPNTAMACAIDVGEFKDIHPQNKRPVGRRLALLAAQLDRPDIPAQSPRYESFEKDGDKIRITFSHAGSGLTAKRVVLNKNENLATGADPEAYVADASSLKGFTVCGPDRKFVSAEAEITGPDTVEVRADSVSEPCAVRYGWANFPLCNLYNSEGLPTVPFRTDRFASEYLEREER